MKYLLIFFMLVAFGCLQQRRPYRYTETPLLQEPESKPVLIEINSVPPPFDLGGDDPYVIWMNGRKVNLPKKDLVELVNKVGEENIPSINPVDIHKGWLWPHYAKREELPENRERARQLKTSANK